MRPGLRDARVTNRCSRCLYEEYARGYKAVCWSFVHNNTQGYAFRMSVHGWSTVPLLCSPTSWLRWTRKTRSELRHTARRRTLQDRLWNPTLDPASFLDALPTTLRWFDLYKFSKTRWEQNYALSSRCPDAIGRVTTASYIVCLEEWLHLGTHSLLLWWNRTARTMPNVVSKCSWWDWGNSWPSKGGAAGDFGEGADKGCVHRTPLFQVNDGGFVRMDASWQNPGLFDYFPNSMKFEDGCCCPRCPWVGSVDFL